MKPASTRTQRFWLDLTPSLHYFFAQVMFTAQANRCSQRKSSGVERRVAGQTVQLLSQAVQELFFVDCLTLKLKTLWAF